MNRVRVLLADDHMLLAEGLRSILEQEYEVIGVAANGRELVELAAGKNPDIVLLDIAMPIMNGLEAATRLRTTHPTVKLVFVTQQADRHYVAAAFRAGANAYVLKQSAASELLTGLREVMRGGAYISPAIARDLPPLRQLRNETQLFADEITPRQREVLQLVAEGKTIKEIAAILNVSAKTVEFHKRGIMEALGMRTTAELTRYALEHGIISMR